MKTMALLVMFATLSPYALAGIPLDGRATGLEHQIMAPGNLYGERYERLIIKSSDEVVPIALVIGTHASPSRWDLDRKVYWRNTNIGPCQYEYFANDRSYEFRCLLAPNDLRLIEWGYWTYFTE